MFFVLCAQNLPQCLANKMSENVSKDYFHSYLLHLSSRSLWLRRQHSDCPLNRPGPFPKPSLCQCLFPSVPLLPRMSKPALFRVPPNAFPSHQDSLYFLNAQVLRTNLFGGHFVQYCLILPWGGQVLEG